jgi:ribosome-associated translation inhibitor RaiA
MLVHVVTDNHIAGSENLNDWITGLITASFDRFGPQLMTIEVHLSDANADKQGAIDKCCLLEARLSGMEPVVASSSAATLEQCVDGAIDTLLRSLDRKLERQSEKKGATSFSGK